MFLYNFLKSYFYYAFVDYNDDKFPTGLLCFSGRQGTGKTISAVKYIYDLRFKKRYNFLFYTNTDIFFSDGNISDIADMFDIIKSNPNNNIIFFLDELQNTFSTSNSKNFDESVLSLITQLRKQKIHIVCTSQVFTRLAKPLREQVHTVCICDTFFNRCTTNKFYLADDYIMFFSDTSERKLDKLIPFRRLSFFQDDKLRNMYDTYALVNKLSNTTRCFNYSRVDNI